MSRYKGQTELFILLMILAVILIGIYLLIYFEFLFHFINIKKQVNLFVDFEDDGTNIIALLNAKKGDNTYAEVIGNLNAKNYADYMDLSELEQTLKKTGSRITVLDILGNRLYGDASADDNWVDIALPGGLKGSVSVE